MQPPNVVVRQGDGRLPFTRARGAAQRLFIGVDASAAGMSEYSGRALRARIDNVFYVRAGVEALPPELRGIASEVSVVLPWGSLLASVARPLVEPLRAIRGLCEDGATLEVVLALDPGRDRAEIARLGIPSLQVGALQAHLAPTYGEAGFDVVAVRALDLAQLRAWPTTWARRLAFAQPRHVVHVRARSDARASRRSVPRPAR